MYKRNYSAVTTQGWPRRSVAAFPTRRPGFVFRSLFRIGQCGTGAGFSLGISIYPFGVASVLLASRPSVTHPLILAIDSVVSHA